MALSSALIRRLNHDSTDEPLAKRIRLATNVFYSPEIPIVRKEDCLLSWLSSELSKSENTSLIWTTIHQFLSADSKTFTKLSQETKKCLIEKLTNALDNYPQNKVLDNMLRCSNYIFQSIKAHQSLENDGIIQFLCALVNFTCTVLDSNDPEVIRESEYKNLVLESSECAISAYSQICKEASAKKENFIASFIEVILVPLSSLVKVLRVRKISSKIILEAQKCIRRLLFSGVKNVSNLDENSEKSEEVNKLFDALKNKINASDIESVKAAISCIFQCVVNTFQQNPEIIDFIMRKLVECCDHKEKSKQTLICILENSIDISYNFDNKINELSLKMFLKCQIDKVTSKKKHLKVSDFELLSSIAKLNPLIIEDVTQQILELILFPLKKSDSEETANENLIVELWNASVRLRRQQKFLSKILVVINNFEYQKIENLELDHFRDLPQSFFTSFGQDLKNKTTNSQTLAMLHTLIFHLKSNCFTKLRSSESAAPYVMIQIVDKLLVAFFENSNFLDSSLTHEWSLKFYQALVDIREILAAAAESICENTNSYNSIIFLSYFNMIKIWCEVYDLMKYYVPSVVLENIEFPLNDSHFKKIRQQIKDHEDSNCNEAVDQILLCKINIYNRDDPNKNQLIKKKFISQLWPKILESHFDLTQSLDNEQMLKLSINLVKKACTSQNELIYWNSIIKNNIVRMSKKFASAIVFAIIQDIVEDLELCSAKVIFEKIDFEELLSTDDEKLKKVLKKAKKEISNQSFIKSDALNFRKIKQNLIFLSNLPVIFLDTKIRIFLFIMLYTLEEEIANNTKELKKLCSNLYSEFLHYNDFDILNYMSNPLQVIMHFEDDESTLKKIFKLSSTNLQSLNYWEEFVSSEKCDKKTSSILISCIDSLKLKSFSTDHKNILNKMSLALKDKILKEPYEESNDPNQLSGLRVAIKISLSDKKTDLEPGLQEYLETLLKNFSMNPDVSNSFKATNEYLQLYLVMLSHREKFKINDGIIKSLSETLLDNPDEKILSHFFELLKNNEFEFFAKSLTSKTEKSLLNNKVQSLEKMYVIWEHLSKVEAKATRSKILHTFVNNLLNKLINLSIKNNSSVYLLKIFRTFILSKRIIQLTDVIIDSVFIIAIECLTVLDNDSKLTASQEALGLCLDFVRSRVEFVVDRLPPLTNLFKKTVSIILTEINEIDKSKEQLLRVIAIDIEKFCSFFAKLKKDVVRISPYLIADLIDLTSQVGVLPPFLKTSIETSISHLLSNHDRHAINFLSRTLPASTQQVFKTLYDNYIKYHKFSGKI